MLGFDNHTAARPDIAWGAATVRARGGDNMGFVRTKEEIARIQESLSKPRFVNCEMLAVDFLTRHDTVAHLLPPGLQPTDNPRATALVGRWQSNCVGDFDGGALYIEARHKDIVGDYVLAMYMDRDQPIIYGRELFGEPKKQSTTRLFRRGDRMNGSVDRYGARLIDLDVQLTKENGPSQAEGVNFNYKALPAANGIGLEWDPVLTVLTFDIILRRSAEGEGAVQLTGTALDPLDEVEVVEVIGGRFLEGDMITRCEAVATVSAEEFLPYALGRTDDWSVLNTEDDAAKEIPSAGSGKSSSAAA
jgi:acetoacetate decarboxylase